MLPDRAVRRTRSVLCQRCDRAAGFQYEDTPFSNFDIRVDVSNGDWERIVAVGGVNENNGDVGYEVVWSLTQPAQ